MNVCKALLSHKAKVLQRLHLITRSERSCDAMEAVKLIEIAFDRNVRELVLHLRPMEEFIFPKCLYNCETLETLELSSSDVLTDVPSSVSLKSLTTLNLNCVAFKDDESVLNLLSGCPKLENLVLRRKQHDNVKTITIAVPSLQRLSIFKGSDHQPDSWFERPPIFIGPRTCWVINAPSLKYLKIGDIKALDSFKNKFPTSIIFYQLVYLELLTYEEEWWNLLTFMLDSSPKLQVLKLSRPSCQRNYFLPCGKWNEPKNVLECLLFHLETFLWEYYDWERGNYKVEVAKYIPSNTNRLKRATFSTTTKITRNRRVKMLEDLNSVVKASNSCQILLK